MQVLNRYVSQGVDSTLVTLTVGVLVAIALELAFRQARMHLAQRVSADSDEDMSADGYKILTRSKLGSLEQVAPDSRREIINGINNVEQAFNASNICAVLDVPFALFFVFVLYLLEPAIALVVLAFFGHCLLGGLWGAASTAKKKFRPHSCFRRVECTDWHCGAEAETVRAFNAGTFLRSAWGEHSSLVHGLRRLVGMRQGLVQSLTQSANAILSVVVIVIAGILVVQGELDVGSMIGINILAARALRPISRFSQLGTSFTKANNLSRCSKSFRGCRLRKRAAPP